MLIHILKREESQEFLTSGIAMRKAMERSSCCIIQLLAYLTSLLARKDTKLLTVVIELCK